MAEKRTLEQRLDELESRAAIADLVHRYARCIRRDEPEGVSALFTEDGIFEVRDGHPDKAEFTVRFRHEGRGTVHAQMSHMKGSAHPVPLIHNLIVELAGEEASGNCVMEAQIHGGSNKIIGEYRDRFRRVGGSWLFAARIYTIFSAASST